MDAGRNTWFRKKALDIVVGIEVGVLGGAAMLALMMLIAPLLGQSWWTYPNLFASHYYSRAVVRYAPGMVTLSGVGLQLFWAGIIGAIAGFLSPRGRAAMTVAMFWFLACYFVIWRKYAPGLATYGSGALLFASFLVYGSVLRMQPKFVAKVRPPVAVEPPVAHAPLNGAGHPEPAEPATDAPVAEEQPSRPNGDSGPGH
jgi:hypothetical protein